MRDDSSNQGTELEELRRHYLPPHLTFDGDIQQITTAGQFGMSGDTFLGIAVNQGSPHTQTAEEILLLCTTARISTEARGRLSQILAQTVNWRYLLDLAAFHGLIPLIVHNLVVSGLFNLVPDSYFYEMKRAYRGMAYRNLTLSSELAKIIGAFNQYGIKTICLGGTFLDESLYGNPCLRPRGNLKILVHTEDMPEAGKLLTNLGYEQKQSKINPSHMERYQKRASFSLTVELLRHLDGSNSASFPEEEIWRRAQPLPFQGTFTMMLSPEDNLLFLAHNLYKHDSYRLKSLADIAELLKKYEESLDWDYIAASAKTWQIAPAVYYALRQAKQLAGAPVPVSTLEAMKPGAWRRWLLDPLTSRKTAVSPISNDRLRNYVSALTRSLMMKSPLQMLRVLRRQYSPNTKGAWLRITLWVMPIVASALWSRNAPCDTLFSRMFDRRLRQKRLQRVINYLRNTHGDITTEIEVSILEKRFVISPGVFCPRGTFASEFMARNLMVAPGDAVLDIRTGVGVQAIIAAERARKVVATDINAKAILCAKRNIHLNGLEEKVEVREGDLFEPIPHEQFDLIIWNAPYLPLNPRSLLEASWCSGRDHGLIERFLNEARNHLTSRGKIQILFSSIGDLSWLINKAEASSYETSIIASMTAGWEHLVILSLTPKKC